jgi:hypothetical protein
MSDAFFQRVRVSDGATEAEMWEHIIDDRVAGYVPDDRSQTTPYAHHLKVEYVAWGGFPKRAMIDDPWSAEPKQIF